MKYSTEVFIEEGTKRNALRLPDLRFIVADDWIDKLGDKAFISWLKIYSWANRSSVNSEINPWNQATVPRSLKNIMKELKVGNDTFYNKILKPLWNFGLIDLEEYEGSNKNGTNAINIIVFQFPQNKPELLFKPLEKVRDYNKDYQSNARKFAKKGGRPKKTISNVNPDVEKDKNNITETEIEQTKLPIQLKQTMIKNKQKINNKKLELKQIIEIYENNKENLSLNEINNILKRSFDMEIKSNFYNYLQKSILNRIAELESNINQSQQETGHKHKEVIPDWLDIDKKHENKPKEYTDEEKEEVKETDRILDQFIKKKSTIEEGGF